MLSTDAEWHVGVIKAYFELPLYNAKAAATAIAATVTTDRDAMPAAPLLHFLVESAVISVTVVFPASRSTS